MADCPKCHAEVPSEAAFCSKCGERLVQRAADQPPKAKRGVYVALFAVTVIAIIAVVIAVAALQSRRSTPTSSAVAVTRPAAQPQPHTTILLAGDSNVLNPGQFKYWTFKIEPEMQNPRVQGKFEATGGTGKDVRVLLLTAPQFVQWRNRELNFPKVYDSGPAHASFLDVRLQESGTYHLVIDNTFSVMSAKNVAGDIALIYER